MKILPPEEYSFHERRKHERLQPVKTCYAAIELNKAVMKKAIYDISIGGFAIILPKSEKVNVSKGKIIPLVVLEIDGKKMKLNVECVNSVTIDRYKIDDLPYGGYKIAFRFAQVSTEDRAFLTEYVTHQVLLKLHIKKAN
jgi:c-di-GMP-binding flagellar brake protein YcgR